MVHSRAFWSQGDPFFIPRGRLPPKLSKMSVMIFFRQLTGPVRSHRSANFYLIMCGDTLAEHVRLTLLHQLTQGGRGRQRFHLSVPFAEGKSSSPSLPLVVAPIDFEPFVLPGPQITSPRLLKSCTPAL